MSDRKACKSNAGDRNQPFEVQSGEVQKHGQGAVRKPAPDGQDSEPLPPNSKK